MPVKFSNIANILSARIIPVILAVSFVFVNYAGYFHHHNQDESHFCGCSGCASEFLSNNDITFRDLEGKKLNYDECNLCKVLKNYDRNFLLECSLTPNFENLIIDNIFYSIINVNHSKHTLRNKSPPFC
ncbi:MAG: hypothetical protein KIT33_05060 [Candidatus Kapabacteria bacterium]|nr:hypothetical protein [Ignavibacteriota bacterium]MCW5884325.1 hypothetical protein [Candidatus Kapabacteria bacterium]